MESTRHHLLTSELIHSSKSRDPNISYDCRNILHIGYVSSIRCFLCLYSLTPSVDPLHSNTFIYSILQNLWKYRPLIYLLTFLCICPSPDPNIFWEPLCKLTIASTTKHGLDSDYTCIQLTHSPTHTTKRTPWSPLVHSLQQMIWLPWVLTLYLIATTGPTLPLCRIFGKSISPTSRVWNGKFTGKRWWVAVGVRLCFVACPANSGSFSVATFGMALNYLGLLWAESVVVVGGLIFQMRWSTKLCTFKFYYFILTLCTILAGNIWRIHTSPTNLSTSPMLEGLPCCDQLQAGIDWQLNESIRKGYDDWMSPYWRCIVLWTHSFNRGFSRGDGPLVAQMTEVIVEAELGGEKSW